MSSLKILSIGEAAIDAYMREDLGSVQTHVSGSAVNTSKNYKALGHKSKARIWIGHDSHGKRIERNLVDSGVVSVAFVVSGKSTPHNLFLTSKTNDKLIPLIESTNHLPEILSYKDVPLLKSANWIHLSSVNSTPSSINKIFSILCKDVAIPLTWSPGPRQIKDGFHSFDHLLRHTVVLTVNQQELLIFTGRRNPEYAIRDLHKAGVKLIVVTNHDNIVQVISENERFTITPPHGKVKDHHGAGDRWASTFTSYVTTDFDIIKAMQLATFHTHLLLKENGADSSLLSKEELEKKFSKEKKNYLVHIHDYS